MDLFSELLRINAPLVAVVEPDLLWARQETRMVVDRLAGEGAGRVLEWDAARGWTGTEDLMHVSGLPTIVNCRTNTSDSARHMDQFVTWLKGIVSQEGYQLEDSVFQRGIALVHDVQYDLDKAVVIRLLLEMVAVLPEHLATVVLFTPEPIPETNPLAPAMVQVRLSGGPMGRFGEMSEAFLEAMAELGGDVKAETLAKALSGLSMASADTALRLTARRLMADQRQGDLLAVLADVKSAMDLPDE